MDGIVLKHRIPLRPDTFVFLAHWVLIGDTPHCFLVYTLSFFHMIPTRFRDGRAYGRPHGTGMDGGD